MPRKHKERRYDAILSIPIEAEIKAKFEELCAAQEDNISNMTRYLIKKWMKERLTSGHAASVKFDLDQFV